MQPSVAGEDHEVGKVLLALTAIVVAVADVQATMAGQFVAGRKALTTFFTIER
jgi:hypothetical protein